VIGTVLNITDVVVRLSLKKKKKKGTPCINVLCVLVCHLVSALGQILLKFQVAKIFDGITMFSHVP
jgi:hypothetical protein